MILMSILLSPIHLQNRRFWKSESPFADGHDLLTATLGLHMSKPTQPSFPYRDYKAICATTLTEYLKGLNWSVAESAPFE